MDEILKDPRFAHVPKDPKFRRIPKSERKVKIDKRFQSMFKDKKFAVKYTIDKRGRPINQTSSEDLKKYYDMSSSDEESAEDEKDETSQENLEKVSEKSEKTKAKKEKKKELKKKSILKKEKENDSDDSESLESSKVVDEDLQDNENQLKLRIGAEDKKIGTEIKKKLKDLTIDYARGEGVLLSDSSSDEESSEAEDEEEEEDIDHKWGELDKEAETTDDITSRLAACNMDWDRLRAVDLMVLFNSFLPPGGIILSIGIYPSEFGIQRMKEEEVQGPMELVDSKKDKDDFEAADDGFGEIDDENEEGSAYTMEKMRQYQLNRLKYYYAVITCDSPETANKIYTECDGIEYESTATKLDLRFIPDDMEFEQEPKEICEKLPELSKYEPRQFTTTALQQVKVELTWDETKPERQEITQKLNSGKINELDDRDIHAYLASGTSDESEGESDGDRDQSGSDLEESSKKNPLEKYKSLLKSIEDKEEEKKKNEVELEFTWGLGSNEKSVQKKLKESEDLTPFEKYLEKRKEKLKSKREERKKLRDANNESDNEDDIPSDVDMDDPYFAEEMKNRKAKVSKKNNKKKESESEDEETTQRKAELELLLLDKNDEMDKQHFNMKKIEENELLSKSKKKRLSKKKKVQKAEADEDNFEVDVKDARFNALFTSHHYHIDPADPHFRKTKGTEALVSEKLKRRAEGDIREATPVKQSKQKSSKEELSADLAALVKSVKRNTKNISRPIK